MRALSLVAIAFVLCAYCDTARAADCSLTLPTTVNLGSYDPTVLNTTTNATFVVSYACLTGSNASNLTVTAGLGSNATGTTFDTRNMRAGGTDRLNYWLYPPGYSVTPHSSANVWGDGSGTSKVWGPFSVVGGSAATSGTASVQIDSNQDVSAGSYSDPIVFTMTFV